LTRVIQAEPVTLVVIVPKRTEKASPISFAFFVALI